MATSLENSDNNSSLTLSQEFDQQLKNFNAISDSELATNDENLQVIIFELQKIY